MSGVAIKTLDCLPDFDSELLADFEDCQFSIPFAHKFVQYLILKISSLAINILAKKGTSAKGPSIHKRRLLFGGGRGVEKLAIWGNFQGVNGATGGGRVVKNCENWGHVIYEWS